VNPQDPLAELHPLREPLPIGWWPPAPGWWVLAAILLVSLLALAVVLIRRYRANAYRRQALRQLALLQSEYQSGQDAGVHLARTNALLKSVALVAYPRRNVAASSGQDWLAFLNAGLGSGEEQFPPDFATAAYRRNVPPADLEQVHRAAAAWIKKHEVAR
jgi:hypothetical protein